MCPKRSGRRSYRPRSSHADGDARGAARSLSRETIKWHFLAFIEDIYIYGSRKGYSNRVRVTYIGMYAMIALHSPLLKALFSKVG